MSILVNANTKVITQGFTGAQGTFVAINNTVSQSVPHLHVHVVPRVRKDGLRGFFWPRRKYEAPEEMAAAGEAIRRADRFRPVRE